MKDEDEIWSLGKQKQKIEAGVSGPRVPPSMISHPQVVSDSSAKRLMWDITLMLALIGRQQTLGVY